MKIRTIAILVIILTNLVIILFSVSLGILFVQRNMDLSLEIDLRVMSNIADNFISSELDNLKLKISSTALALDMSDETEWYDILAGQSSLYPEFTGMSVLETSRGLITSYGEMHADKNIINDHYINQAFIGKNIITSTFPAGNSVVFYLAAPMPSSHNKILVATLAGTHFSQLLSGFVIWESGHIFMSDSQGYAIANPREEWIQNRFNYIYAAQTDKDFIKLAETVTLMTRGESGIGYYTVYGVPRVCAFRPVSGSNEGWSLGVIAPLAENPVRNTERGLLIVALVSIILSVIAAVIASNFINKPFERIEILKEDADAANKAKSTFLSTMSHEIRTPMNAILGVSEIQLQKETLEPDMREAFGNIYTSGDLLLSIINDILDLSKIEAGKLELVIEKYEIASMISDTTQLNMMRLGSKPIEFILDINENTPSFMIGDELRIKQILNNLLSNSIKYTMKGIVKLSVFSEAGKNDDETILVMTVFDTGQGMTGEQVGRIYDEFSQFNVRANHKTEGTGLGMSITKKLVSLMNGNILIDSEPGKGTVFTVRIPQGTCVSEALGPEMVKSLSQFRMHSRDYMEKVRISREPMPYGRVLIVDDVDANIYVAKGLLSPYELKMESADGGYKAIEIIKEGNVFDIIFMDHMMPDIDGIETTKLIRDFGYTAPIIALSANAVSGQADIFLENGFDDFLSKPIDIRQLNYILNKYIRDKQPQDVLVGARKNKLDTIEAKNNLKNKNEDTETASGRERNSQLLNMEITGLNISKGIARFDGKEEVYLEVLRSYLESITSMLENIETVDENSLDSYKIKVHGIKGTSMDIYAEDIANEARALENAAKSGDYKYIREHNSSFVENARNLLAEIDNLFINLESKRNKPKKDKPDMEILKKLMTACNDYDMDGADAAIADLEEYVYEADDGLVEWLRFNIDRMHMEEITQKLSHMVKI
ncbi:MAG: ATP-binding protein [Treponema sp.]|nr:ATP-binding protein [Treponema sp.]